MTSQLSHLHASPAKQNFSCLVIVVLSGRRSIDGILSGSACRLYGTLKSALPRRLIRRQQKSLTLSDSICPEVVLASNLGGWRPSPTLQQACKRKAVYGTLHVAGRQLRGLRLMAGEHVNGCWHKSVTDLSHIRIWQSDKQACAVRRGTHVSSLLHAAFWRHSMSVIHAASAPLSRRASQHLQLL